VNKIKAVVLVVGESHEWRLPVVTILQRGGYVTLEATNGFEALQTAISNCIDLLISDDEMAGLSGRELIGIVRRHGAIARCILVSNAPEDAQGLPENTEVLAAPFQPDELLGRVRGSFAVAGAK
jgi:CheY-like chemotaxis protein